MAIIGILYSLFVLIMTDSAKINKKKLFIGNLDWGVTSEGLKEVFSKWGEVVQAIVVKRPDGRSKGFGFVEYTNEEDAQKAKDEAHNGEINGRTINVDYSQESERKERPQRDYNNNRGGSYGNRPQRSYNDRRNSDM